MSTLKNVNVLITFNKKCELPAGFYYSYTSFRSFRQQRKGYEEVHVNHIM